MIFQSEAGRLLRQDRGVARRDGGEDKEDQEVNVRRWVRVVAFAAVAAVSLKGEAGIVVYPEYDAQGGIDEYSPFGTTQIYR